MHTMMTLMKLSIGEMSAKLNEVLAWQAKQDAIIITTTNNNNTITITITITSTITSTSTSTTTITITITIISVIRFIYVYIYIYICIGEAHGSPGVAGEAGCARRRSN